MAWVTFTEHFVLLSEQQTMLQRLDPVTRARVLAALLGLIILGFGLMLLAWLGARVARRYRQRVVNRTRPVRKPHPELQDVPSRTPAGDFEASDGLEEGS